MWPSSHHESEAVQLSALTPGRLFSATPSPFPAFSLLLLPICFSAPLSLRSLASYSWTSLSFLQVRFYLFPPPSLPLLISTISPILFIFSKHLKITSISHNHRFTFPLILSHSFILQPTLIFLDKSQCFCVAPNLKIKINILISHLLTKSKFFVHLYWHYCKHTCRD